MADAWAISSFDTNSVRPSGLSAIPRGRLPTARVATTEPVVGATTLIVFAISLLTYNSGLGLCAGAAVAHSASATTLETRAAITNLPPDAMSVVEDRLVSIEGLV